MARTGSGSPGFDDYVAARGTDLLRTAWLLTGDEAAARRQVQEALRAAWPQWHHLTESGGGSYDRELRRLLLRGYLHTRGRRVPDPSTQSGATAGPGGAAARLGEALLDLDRLDRARVVLALADGLTDPQVAALLDEPPATSERLRLRATQRLATAAAVDEDELAAALEELVPETLSTDGLGGVMNTSRHRGRRAAGWLAAVAALGVAVAVGSLAGRPTASTPKRAPSATVTTTTLGLTTCLGTPEPSDPLPDSPVVGEDVVAAVVCPRTDADSVWTGFLPPSESVTVRRALALLRLEQRGPETDCGDVPHGPAFRLLLERAGGAVRTYANETMRCNGWPALDSFYRALAEQEAVESAERWNDGFPGCPPVFDPARSNDPSAAVVPRGTTFVAGALCLHPLPVDARVPRVRHVVRRVMAQSQLDVLNAELSRHGSVETGSARACPGSTALYVVRGLTAADRVIELSGACPAELRVDWSARHVIRLGPQAAAVVASVTDTAYR